MGRKVAADGMIRGTLKHVPLADMFQLVANSQKTGIMTLERQGVRARLYFELGRLSYAHMVPGSHLGEILVRMDLLSVHDVQEILARQRTESAGSRLGQMALEMGFIDDDELAAAIDLQAAETLSELLTWDEGGFEFTGPDPAASQSFTGEGIDAQLLMMRVASGIDERGKGVAADAVLSRSGDPTAVELPTDGWEILGHVDGRRSARSIAAELDLSAARVYYVLAKLVELGVLEHSPYQVSEPLVLVVSPSDTFGRLLQLALHRAGLKTATVASYEGALAGIEAHLPKAVLIDDDDEGAWDVIREVRRSSSHGHLPVLLLVDKPPKRNPFRPLPRAELLTKPFEEAELQQRVQRLLGKAFRI